ncbi:MAG: beta-ketoacyl-ACP reductase [Candidatus Eremiobacteraeota bacterium]|nr:beta-ketoacyl-ACP reductase [Candidatus Eremiobacteraeota bacterium]
MNNLPLSGRVGIVTGGSRGIGGAISRTLAEDGATVAVLGLPIDRERTEKLRIHLNGSASRLHFYEGNVGSYEQCRAAVANILEEHGRIDYLINNAGITRDHTVRKMTEEEWLAVLQVNLSGPFFMTKAVIDTMVEQHFGRIVNISSVVGESGNFGQANYAAAKAGLIGLTKTVALEVAKNKITVNAVAPGFIETDMTKAMPSAAIQTAIDQTPKRRLGQPEEVAHVVRFLVDDKAGYITGAVYNVNGGWYM